VRFPEAAAAVQAGVAAGAEGAAAKVQPAQWSFGVCFRSPLLLLLLLLLLLHCHCQQPLPGWLADP
jgi:hypothetical protein